MIDARFVPLDIKDFPNARPATDRLIRCPFKSAYSKTLELLEAELRRFNAVDVEVFAGFKRNQIANHGMPLASARPDHPAVILGFREARADKPYSFPCDMFALYQVNLHAIALTLQHLRGVERYGVAQGNRQYAGFLAIEAPKSMNVDEAAQWLAEQAGSTDWPQIVHLASTYRAAYRIVAARVHPDVVGTDDGRWSKLSDVKRLLDAHFGLAKEQVAR